MSDTDDRRARIEKAWEPPGTEARSTRSTTCSAPTTAESAATARRNLTEFKASIIATRSAFPDLLTTVDEIVVEGDRAAIRWHSAGNHEHSFLGVPATKREVRSAARHSPASRTTASSRSTSPGTRAPC